MENKDCLVWHEVTALMLIVLSLAEMLIPLNTTMEILKCLNVGVGGQHCLV